MIPPCESCGAPAEVQLADQSKWCMSCHIGALIEGYDNDLGTLITKETA